MKDFIDKTSEQDGTPLNREALMALQGFQSKTIAFNSDGSIVETNEQGHTLTTTFGSDGSVLQVFNGEKVISKRTEFKADGGITEEVF